MSIMCIVCVFMKHFCSLQTGQHIVTRLSASTLSVIIEIGHDWTQMPNSHMIGSVDSLIQATSLREEGTVGTDPASFPAVPISVRKPDTSQCFIIEAICTEADRR